MMPVLLMMPPELLSAALQLLFTVYNRERPYVDSATISPRERFDQLSV